jgi:hypothetical protein
VKNRESREQEGTGIFKNSPPPILLYLEKIIVVVKRDNMKCKNRRVTEEGDNRKCEK